MFRLWRRISIRAEEWWLRNAPFAVIENPFELFIALLCVVAGIPYLTGTTAPGSLDALLPPVWVIVWGIQLVFGGMLVAIGLLRRNIYIEKAGLWPLSVASLVYSVSLFEHVGLKASVSFFVTFAFSVACWSRLILVRAVLRIPPIARGRDVE